MERGVNMKTLEANDGRKVTYLPIDPHALVAECELAYDLNYKNVGQKRTTVHVCEGTGMHSATNMVVAFWVMRRTKEKAALSRLGLLVPKKQLAPILLHKVQRSSKIFSKMINIEVQHPFVLIQVPKLKK